MRAEETPRCATQQSDRNGVSARWPWQRGAEMDGGRRGLPLRAGDRRLRGEAETLRRGAGTAPAPVGVFHAALRPRTGEPERRGEASVLLLSFICYCRRQATRSRECSGRSLCSPWPGPGREFLLRFTNRNRNRNRNCPLVLCGSVLSCSAVPSHMAGSYRSVSLSQLWTGQAPPSCWPVRCLGCLLAET